MNRHKLSHQTSTQTLKFMKTQTLKLAALVLLPAAALVLTSCSSSDSKSAVESSSSMVFRPGVPGGVMVETHQLQATVKSIDAASRKVELATADGKRTTVKCGPDVINFDQIRVGDQLTVTVTEELVAYLARAGGPAGTGGASAIALAPKGAKPGGIVADTVQFTAKVVALDHRNHKAVLQFPDGSTRTVAVRPDVDLRQRKVGEEVVIRITELVAIQVSKPQ